MIPYFPDRRNIRPCTGRTVPAAEFYGKMGRTTDDNSDFNHPLFVIGADSVANLPNWIRGIDLIKENNFIVFPRKNYDLDKIFQNEVLKKYKDHFIIIKDYEEDDVSSTNYRSYKDEMLLTDEVKDYIKKKGLYR